MWDFDTYLLKYSNKIKAFLQVKANHEGIYRALEAQYKKVEGLRAQVADFAALLSSLEEQMQTNEEKQKAFCNYMTRLKHATMGKTGQWIIKSSEIQAQHQKLQQELGRVKELNGIISSQLETDVKVQRDLEDLVTRYYEARQQLDRVYFTLFGHHETRWPMQDALREELEVAIDGLHSLESQRFDHGEALQELEEAKGMLETAIDQVDEEWFKKEIDMDINKGLKIFRAALDTAWNARPKIRRAMQISRWVAQLPDRGIDHSYSYFDLTFAKPISDSITHEHLGRARKEMARCAFGLEKWINDAQETDKMLERDKKLREEDVEQRSEALRNVRESIVRNALGVQKAVMVDGEWETRIGSLEPQ